MSRGPANGGFPPPRSIRGECFLSIVPIRWIDEETGEEYVFPVYRYRTIKTGHHWVTADDEYYPKLDELLEAGIFRAENYDDD